jgi:hypothetical protein
MVLLMVSQKVVLKVSPMVVLLVMNLVLVMAEYWGSSTVANWVGHWAQ